jgi:hypothetical protein
MAAPPDRSGTKPKQEPSVIQKAINLLIDGLIEHFIKSRPSCMERLLREERDVRSDLNW